MPTLRIRRHEGRLSSEGDIARALGRALEILDQAGFRDAPLRFFFDDAEDGPATCAGIVAECPELEPFLQTPPRQSPRLLNFDNAWDIANPAGAGVPAPRDLLLAVTRGVPDRYSFGSIVFVIGPVAWQPGSDTFQLSGRPSPVRFSTRFPAQTYISPGLILQRLGNSKVNVTLTERADGLEVISPVVQRLALELGAEQSRVFEVLTTTRSSNSQAPAPGNATETHTRFRNDFAAFVAGLSLPHDIPDPSALAKAPPEPVGEVRAALVQAFKAYGWKKSAGGRSAGMHRLWKRTTGGRSVALDFDTGSWLRFVTCFAKLVTEAGVFKLPVPADRTMRMQYVTPNRQVFDQVVENLTVVVRTLEDSWVAKVEEALGPVPPGYDPPQL